MHKEVDQGGWQTYENEDHAGGGDMPGEPSYGLESIRRLGFRPVDRNHAAPFCPISMIRQIVSILNPV
jgi:hypothetical protein